MIDAAGIINTVAGTGVSGDTGDEGLATSANIGFPFGLAFDPANNVYVTTLNGVRRIDSAGYIHAFAGNPLVAGFSGNNGPALDAKETMALGVAYDSTSGKVFISESSNHCVRSVDTIGPDAGIIKQVAGNPILDPGGARALDAKIYGTHGFAVDRSGDVYIAENGAHRIRKVTLATQQVTTIAGTGLAGFSGDGGDPRLAQLNLFEAPSITFDAGGNLYWTFDSNRVRRIDMANNIISTYGGNGVQGSAGDNSLATQAQLNRASGLVFDDSGNLFVAEQSGNRVRKITAPTPPAATGIITTYATGFNAPRYVVRDNSGTSTSRTRWVIVCSESIHRATYRPTPGRP
jgi:sugar lactone lactonase YvrE